MAFAALGDAERAWELFTMINPVNHAKSPDAIAVYKTEPYVLAADGYALAPHTGRVNAPASRMALSTVDSSHCHARRPVCMSRK